MDAIVHAISSPKHAAGYVPACGTLEARRAIATHHHAVYGGPLVSSDNVVVASGCSGTLELVLTALLDEDSILLVPKPGFPLYQVICESHGASVAHYELDPDRQWECNLEHMEELILSYDRVRGIVINNPSNPTGSVYTEHHLQQILSLAQRYQLPVIADEVYGDLTFDDAKHPFTSMAKVMMVMGSQVPVIVTSGLAKQYLLPGWRVGWAVFYDRYVSIELKTRTLPQQNN
jgi:tyrosine aminotransferase